MTDEKPIHARLMDDIEIGRTILQRPEIFAGFVKMFSSRVRNRLSQVFGESAPVLAKFEVASITSETPNLRTILEERVSLLEAIMGSIQSAGQRLAGQGTVFFGHGRSPVWRELKDFVYERLGLPYDEFNHDAAAGLTTFERLLEMLDRATFAFLVMTAEDETATGTQARQNVVHELGLFQGRLGQRRAIIVLEERCQEFSNIVGLVQLRFPKNRISAIFEEVRRVYREKVLFPADGHSPQADRVTLSRATDDDTHNLPVNALSRMDGISAWRLGSVLCQLDLAPSIASAVTLICCCHETGGSQMS